MERRDRFLAMLSHELRTPLGAILNASNLLSRGSSTGMPPPACDVIRRQARHMAKLIDDLLDVGRITRDEVVLDARLVDLRALAAQEVMENFRGHADEAGVALRSDLPDDAVWVRGDAVRLRQIFANLLSNAIIYTPRGRTHPGDARRARAGRAERQPPRHRGGDHAPRSGNGSSSSSTRRRSPSTGPGAGWASG